MSDRQAREEKVIATVREWLPELTTPGTAIQITAADPDDPERPDGALFSVTRTRAFACRRGGRG
jgi:hypothetical protein